MDKMTEWKSEFDRLAKPFGANRELAINSISASNSTFYEPSENDAWLAFHNLLQRAWWWRAWIVQEATALRPLRTLLFCGSKMIDWSSLRAALNISHHVTHTESQGMSLTFKQGFAATLLDQFRFFKEQGAYIRLFIVLELIRPFKCQDPRDKLFASLGLAADVSDADIIPDYTRSIEDVCTDIARLSLSQSPAYCLDFLGLVINLPEEYRSERSGWPSWVPDLRDRFVMYAFERYLNVDDFKSSRAHNASDSTAGNAAIYGQYLRVNGSITMLFNRSLPAYSPMNDLEQDSYQKPLWRNPSEMSEEHVVKKGKFQNPKPQVPAERIDLISRVTE